MTIATKSHGTLLKMGSGGSAGAAKTITATAYAAGPGSDMTLVTTSTAHGLDDGDITVITGVTGTGATAVNGTWRAFRVTDLTFLVPVVTTGAGSGGTSTEQAESFATIAEVGDIKGPELTRDEIDATTHDSPNDFEEMIVGLKKSGNVTFKINWNPSNPTHAGAGSLWGRYGDGITTNFQIISPRNDMLAFSAGVAGIGPEYPVNGLVAADITLKVTGEVILTPA
jgi:hypothetical protein